MGINARSLSQSAYERAKQVIPGGVNSPVRALRSVGTTPLFIREANKAYLTDIDDNTYIDFCMSWGVFILGHNNVAVSRKAAEAVGRGSSYGIPTLAETELAEHIRGAIPSMERLRFVNSGTEATMSAIRLARGFTKRDVLVKFEGCYHGHADHLLVSAGSAVANIGNASSAGVPNDFTRHTVCLPYNDVSALKRYFEGNGHRVAAIIIEPVACNMGVVVPTEEFLLATRTLTEQYGALLIFDEVITGFRLSFGGAQQRFGINPDLTTVGKIVGGGFPAPDGPVYQAGTLSGNPVAMAAGIETLHQLSFDGFYEKLEARSNGFIEQLKVIIKDKDIQLNYSGSMFTLFFSERPVHNFADARQTDQQHFARYFQNMLQRGIYVSPSQFEGNFISDCHTPEILDYVLKSIKESI